MFRRLSLSVLAATLVSGCFGSFNPDERKYTCKASQDCIDGYACVRSKGDTDTDPLIGFCARECGEQSGPCPTGFKCNENEYRENTTIDTEVDTDVDTDVNTEVDAEVDTDVNTDDISDVGRARISVCISTDEMVETVASEMGTDTEILPDANPNPAPADIGVAVDISFGPEDCGGLGCGQAMPDVGLVGETDVGVVENGCHNACTGYCEFSETRCQLPCSMDHCIGVCDESDGALVASIIAQSLPGSASCGELIEGRAGDQSTIDIQANYDTLAVSCTEFCQELDTYLTDSINGAGEVCGDFLQCDQTACVSACEVATLEFARNLGELTLSASHAQCPLSAKLVSGVGGSTRSISVKNLCIPCESTCSTLFPGDASAADGISEFWCGITQRHSPCPAVSSRAVCNAQCELHPEQFFVSNALEICGDPTSADPVSIIEGNTPLCGAQCESTNTDWGDVGSFTDQPLTLTYVLAGTTRPIVVERGTRICFREQDAALGDHPRCDVVISIDQQRFARFEVVFDPIGQGGSVSDLSQNTLRYAAQLTAHGESTVTENLFLMAIYSGFSDMLLRESIPNPNADFDGQVYDVETPMLNDGDVALVSRRIGADEYRMEFLFNDVQTPSALTIDHFTIGSTQDIDGSCQNQCFERSGGEFCRDLCDPDEGLIALCAQNIDMPRRAQVPFTSNLSASGQPLSPFCAQGETSGLRLSKDFDADSCLRECKRNRCDLQFQVNALWHPGAANEGGRCHRLNFGGYQGWLIDENFPDDSGQPLDRSSLCCLCSHDYCEAILSNTNISIDCGN